MAEIVEWTITQISENFGYSRRELLRIMDEADVQPVKKESNRKYYRLKPVFEACKFGSERLDLTQQKALNTMEMHRKNKRENDLQEGLVVPIEQLREAALSIASQIGPILDALPGQIKNIAPELTARDMDFIKKKIAECKNSISEIEPE